MTGHDDRVRAWAARLTEGEPITWSAFVASDPAGLPGDGPLPGAQQLEILRRLVALGTSSAALADLVLGSSGPGRGLVDPPLPGAPGGPGVVPVAPEDLPANELVRAACGVLVPLLLRADRTPGRTPGRRSSPRTAPGFLRRRLARRRVMVHGSPGSARAVADALIAAGWVEGGRGARHVVIGRDLETMMAELWADRVLGGAERRWRPLWRRAATLDLLPPRLRVDEIAARLAREHGATSVHLVCAADDRELAVAVGEALDVRLDPDVAIPDSAATDLLRRLHPFLVVAAGEQARRAVVAGPWLRALAEVRATSSGTAPRPLGAPPGRVGWARDAGRRLAGSVRESARAGDYAVHGDPGAIVPDRTRPVAREVDVAEVLDLALRMIVALHRAGTEGGR